MERNCQKCIHHISGLCSKWNCEMQTLEDYRNKVIDEFAEEIAFGIYESVIWDMLATMSKNGSLSDTSDKIVDYVIETSKKIAEQMKAGVENERNTI